MNSNPKLSYAIAAVLSGSAAGLAPAGAAAGAAASATDAIQEITVTAQRRTENMQDVPITIQALTADTLVQLHVATFDDFIKYLPNVTQASNGPGQSNIFMRGLSAEPGGPGGGGSQGSGTTGQFPNVAVYLDDLSASLPGRNLDIYAADLERIEVLEGPQGTLFGSGAEAGVLRYITNKPKLDVTEGSVNAGYSYTAHGDPNSNLDAMINLPLIPDTLAVRAVIYTDSRGGYINNVPSTFTRAGTDEGFKRPDGSPGVVPTDSVVINNNNIVANAINPVTYQGFRLSGLYKINDDWDVLLTQSYQNMNAQGVFSAMPYGSEGVTYNSQGMPIGSHALAPLSVTLFNPSYDKDKFENTALEVTGKIGNLKAVYSGGYLVRNVDQVQDYTNYARGVYGSYYQCAGITKTSTAGTCYTPSTTWHEAEKNTHQSHEFRLSTPDDWRVRAIGGVYWEEYKIYDDTDWLYKTVPTCTAAFDTNCFNNVQPWPGVPANNPNVRGDNVGFFDDFVRSIYQKAAFGSIDVDLIPKTLTLTLGTRYYRFNEDERGGDVGSFYCKVYAPTTYFGPCKTPYGTNLDTQNPNSSKYSGFRSRANLSWKVTDDLLLYYTWSQGFRPGGFNRGVSGHLPDANQIDQYYTPATYAPDLLTNNELGWKSEWLSHHLQFNGAVYQEDWKNAQVAFFDPQGGFGNLTFSTNGPNFRVRGVEIQTVARITDGLTIQGSAAWNSSNQTNSPFLINNNPKSPGYGRPITSVPNPYGTAGNPLANSPPFQANLRARYEFGIGAYRAFWQIGGTHQGNSYSATGNVPKYDQPGYTLYDASFGVSKDAWAVQIFGQNLTNVLASTFTNSPQWIEQQAVTRPRVGGVKFSYRF
ncbi:MAG TPA: TonB-dependent receptor [Steroidobacteraceae bacterium]|nr:TonB-dependent receptor [Steroidobacteraceae bacterium]